MESVYVRKNLRDSKNPPYNKVYVCIYVCKSRSNGLFILFSNYIYQTFWSRIGDQKNQRFLSVSAYRRFWNLDSLEVRESVSSFSGNYY